MARRIGRQRNQPQDWYYEGYLEKRSSTDQMSQKMWTCLGGNTLFFFNDKKDTEYVEKLDLGGLISVTDDSSQGRNLDAARLNLKLKNENVKLTAPNAEARELWKGYICTVSKLVVPPSLNLLPGQIEMLREVVEKEQQRLKNIPPLDIQHTYKERPVCYHGVSRLEAELLLEKEAARGNLLLRPDRKGNAFAISTRQNLDGSVFRHYHVAPKDDGGFMVEVENPVHCDTLQDVINHFIQVSGGVLVPLIIEEDYDKNISYIWSDKENGEKNVEQAQPLNQPPVPATGFPPRLTKPPFVRPLPSLPPKPAFTQRSLEEQDSLNITPPRLPPKPGTTSINTNPTTHPIHARNYSNSYMKTGSENGEDLIPPSLPPRAEPEPGPEPEPEPESEREPEPEPEPVHQSVEEEDIYDTVKDEEEDIENHFAATVAEAKIPPVPAPRLQTQTEMKRKAQIHVQGQIPLATISELKQKLDQRLKIQE